MHRAWTAEHVVSPDLATRLIQAQFPSLHPVQTRLLGEGWDNTVFVVNERYVLRFPRRTVAVECLEAERRILAGLAPRLPLPIPVPSFLGSPASPYPWPFNGYVMLLGLTAGSANLDDSQLGGLAKPLARFLRALHSLPFETMEAWPVPPDHLGRLDLDRRVPQVRERLEILAEQGLIQDATRLHRMLEETAWARTSPRSNLVHGDLYFRHLLVGESGELAAVIDWGDVHWGDPAVDLSIVCGFLPQAGKRLFCQTYGTIDEEGWRLARFRALQRAVISLWYGHEVGGFETVREAERSLKLLETAAGEPAS